MKRKRSWIVPIAVVVGLVPTGVLALWGFMSLNARPLHPTKADVPSVRQLAATPHASAIDRARQAALSHLTEKNLPGLSVAVAAGGEVVWVETFGFSDLANRTPLTPDTRLRIGTASKMLTSAAVGLLVEQGRLNLDEKIQTYVPEFPEKPWPVTLKHLMAQTAGVRNDGGDEGPLFNAHCERPVEAFPHFADRPLLFEPGTAYRDSAYSWIVVSAAAEAAAGESLMSFMRQRIFDPLGMTDTRAESSSGQVASRSQFYFPKFAADPYYGLDPIRTADLSCYSGASAFLSTPLDLVRFGLAIDSDRLLKPATRVLLQTEQQLTSGQSTGYGLGWDFETADIAGKPTRIVGHDGDVFAGIISSFIVLPEPRIIVSVMSNTSYADTYALGVTIAESFSGNR